MNRRILNALATLAIFSAATGVYADPADPVGDLIDQAAESQAAPAPDGADDAAADAPADLASPPPDRAPDFRLRATLYHSGAGGVGVRDASGCRTVPMRTVAVDRRTIPLHTLLFIRETVGVPMPDGRRHDGYWYATDTGGAIRGARIDLYTGMNAGSMRPLMRVNTTTVTVTRAGRFEGCPSAAGPAAGRRMVSASLPIERTGKSPDPGSPNALTEQ